MNMGFTFEQNTIEMKLSLVVPLCLLLFACRDKEQENPTPVDSIQLHGADISFLPQLRQSGLPLYNSANEQKDPLDILKASGVNTVRLRIWHNPVEVGSDFNSVKQLSQECKNAGLQVMLTVHYSDDWVDPAKQTKPASWQATTGSALNDSVYAYTQKIMTEIQPDFIQIGNEINHGLLWPNGQLSNLTAMKSLLQSGIQAVRDVSTTTKIIIHYAGIEGANSFFANFADLDYDIIGLSYYPMWHGKDLQALESSLNTLSTTFNKKTIIAETSYPFTFAWNDWTNNIIGLQEQILDEYPATPEGQKAFLTKLKEIMDRSPNCLGFYYWGGEWVSFKGNTASDGSTWENQAFWDFNGKALPILQDY